jgi:hypothetical protein
MCVTDCPVTSTKSGYLLFKDTVNRKCVSMCPSTAPYGYPSSIGGDRICYANCPSGSYATNATDHRCVTTCSNNATYNLYAYNGSCTSSCPLGYWADPATIKCLANCSSSSYPFKDNSTGINQCVSMCPAPDYFG